MATATPPLAGAFVADPNHSSFQFAVRHMKVSTFRATFDDVEATLADHRLSGSAKVESISIKAPPELREHVVNGEDFFAAGTHPKIAFDSTAVDLADDGTATVEGELTIKGIAQPVRARGTWQPPIEDPYGRRRTALELAATVDRRDWGMNWQMALPKGGDVLGWEVDVSVHLELIG